MAARTAASARAERLAGIVLVAVQLDATQAVGANLHGQ